MPFERPNVTSFQHSFFDGRSEALPLSKTVWLWSLGPTRPHTCVRMGHLSVLG